ncbi:hypothetical protein DERF_003273 [Dermatophagoides farinae]|uniref:Uncharacterized protein n=1 Tax=Dermatophagoides farinae TaxID=6954 RepID=A0A922IF80_DERFA|nr:hypothetical protein DERF_003273 [Dermatophagoides farinae]
MNLTNEDELMKFIYTTNKLDLFCISETQTTEKSVLIEKKILKESQIAKSATTHNPTTKKNSQINAIFFFKKASVSSIKEKILRWILNEKLPFTTFIFVQCCCSVLND